MEKNFKKARFITIVMMAALIFYGMVAGMFSQAHGYGGSAESKMNFLRLVVFLVSLIQIVMALVVRSAVSHLAMAGPKEGRLLTAQVLVNAFCSAPAIFGLIVTFITRSFWDYGIFAAISLLAFSFFFPRKASWLREMSKTK